MSRSHVPFSIEPYESGVYRLVEILQQLKSQDDTKPAFAPRGDLRPDGNQHLSMKEHTSWGNLKLPRRSESNLPAGSLHQDVRCSSGRNMVVRLTNLINRQ